MPKTAPGIATIIPSATSASLFKPEVPLNVGIVSHHFDFSVLF
jgi:hypothetical protein